MKSVFYIILAFFFLGCDSDALDRSKAGSIITNYYKYPIVEIVTIRAVDMGDMSDSQSHLVDQGYLYRQASLDNEGTFDHHLTEKGMTYYLSGDPGDSFNMVGNKLTFIEVTGIRTLEGERKAIVDYTEKRSDISPFGQVLEYKDSDLVEKEVTMELYDDGWRITTKNADVNITAENPVSGSRKNSAEETKQLNSIITENKESMPDEENVDEDDMEEESSGESSASFFLLKRAFVEDGAYLVEVDYIGEDGSNNNPKLRTFQIRKDFNTLDNCGRFPNSGRIKDFDDLFSLQKDSPKLFMVVKNNIVSCIEYTEIPEVQTKQIKDIPRKPGERSSNKKPVDSINLITKDTIEQKVKDTIPKAPEN